MKGYNIYINGELIFKDMSGKETEDITGLSAGNIPYYLGRKYNHNGLIYEIKPTGCAVNEEKVLSMSQEWKDGWNNMHDAAQKIKAGTHHIVTKYRNGKYIHVTEEKG